MECLNDEGGRTWLVVDTTNVEAFIAGEEGVSLNGDGSESRCQRNETSSNGQSGRRDSLHDGLK